MENHQAEVGVSGEAVKHLHSTQDLSHGRVLLHVFSWKTHFFPDDFQPTVTRVWQQRMHQSR